MPAKSIVLFAALLAAGCSNSSPVQPDTGSGDGTTAACRPRPRITGRSAPHRDAHDGSRGAGVHRARPARTWNGGAHVESGSRSGLLGHRRRRREHEFCWRPHPPGACGRTRRNCRSGSDTGCEWPFGRLHDRRSGPGQRHPAEPGGVLPEHPQRGLPARGRARTTGGLNSSFDNPMHHARPTMAGRCRRPVRHTWTPLTRRHQGCTIIPACQPARGRILRIDFPPEAQTMTAIEETARDITLKVIEQQAYGPISDDASEAIRIGEYAAALYRTILEGVRGAHESAQSGVGAVRQKRT